ncbi:MAG: 6-bladed beta-propeller [Prevotellaceae bacterium]|jgi:hypothetical protein|nr:6-bladed beta-propeller [Prevotellaceae bacterium]
MKYLCILFIVIVFYGCHSGEKKYSGDISIVCLEEKNTDPLLLSAVIDSVSFLPLIEQDNFLFGNINKLIMHREYIYIMDVWISNSLLVFDNTGVFVRKIGKKGDGPEEYGRLRDFDVDSEYIYMYDEQKRILKYDLQGNFIEKKRTPFSVSEFKILKNRKYLFALEEDKDNKYQIVHTDSVFNVEASFFPFPFEYDESKGLIYRDNILQTVDEVIFYSKLHSDTVYSFSNEGNFIGGVLFDFGQKTLPERLRNNPEEFAMGTEKSNFKYFADTPFKVDQLWIGGSMANEKYFGTFVYDNISDKYYFYRRNLDYTNVNLPMFANSKYIIGWMDINVYNRLEKKPAFSSSTMAILEEGGHVLSFYHLRQNRRITEKE